MKMDNYSFHNEQWIDGENKQYSAIIIMAITCGRNADKLSKFKFIKNVFKQLEDLAMIDDECMEKEIN